ncbi:MAG: ribosomal-processing cysteine protease Prp [Ruminococcus sp.]
MTKVVFFTHNGMIAGFSVDGHTGYSDEGSDIVCASVSSAAYMTANTITDVQKLNVGVEVMESHLYLTVDEKDVKEAQVILKGFKLHMDELAKQYGDYIKVIISEV